MKYFTNEWWSTGGEDFSPFEAYMTYFRANESRLPSALRTFIEKHTVHDAKIVDLKFLGKSQSVIVVLHGWDKEFNNRMTYTLNFKGVLDSRFPLPGPPDYGHLDDLGYIELEIVNDGVEMRGLFASGVEFNVTFSDFSFDAVPRSA